jgi:hypothetical protein
MGKYKLLKKSYKIDFTKISEGYLSCGESCYADSLNEAKVKLLKQIEYSSWELNSGNEITYLNIPVIRDQEGDLLEFQGQELTLFAIHDLIRAKERNDMLDAILQNEDAKFCYILKRGEYYRPNSCGYTSFISRAGIFTKEEAVIHAKSCAELALSIIDIPKHNEIINKEIEDLKLRLIN